MSNQNQNYEVQKLIQRMLILSQQELSFCQKDKKKINQDTTQHNNIQNFIDTIILQFIQQYYHNKEQDQWIWQLYHSEQKQNNQIKNVKQRNFNKNNQEIKFDQKIRQTIQIRQFHQKSINHQYNQQQPFQQQKIMSGYKFLKFKQNQQQQTCYLFNHPLRKKEKCGFQLAKLSNQMILLTQSNQDKVKIMKRLYKDFYEQQLETDLIMINPNVNFYLNQNDNNKQTDFINIIQSQTPNLIILTESNLTYLLSTIWYQYLFREVQWACNNNKNSIIKVMTTKEIYQRYLRVLGVVQMLGEEIKAMKMKKFDNYDGTGRVCQICEKIQQQLNNNKFSAKKIKQKNGCFQLITPNQPIQYLTLSFCFRSPNIFIYPTYDLQIHLPSTNLSDKQSSSLKLMIQGHSYNNIKKLYYNHKNKKITEREYIGLIRRIEEKENKVQEYWSCLSLGQVKGKDVKVYENVNNIQGVLVELSGESDNTKSFMMKSIENKVRVNTEFKTQINRNDQLARLLYHKPHEIPTFQKQYFYPQSRNLTTWLLLTDEEIQQILNYSDLLDYMNNQVVINSTMKLEDVYVVLRGRVEVVTKGNQRKILKRNEMHGWEYFLYEFETQSIIKSQMKQKSLFIEKLSVLSLKSDVASEAKKQYESEKGCRLKVISARALILKIPYDALDFWLHYKKPLILKQLSQTRQ